MGIRIDRVTAEHAVETSKDVARRISVLCRRVKVIDPDAETKIVVIECDPVPAKPLLCRRLMAEPTFRPVNPETWGSEFAAFRFRGVMFQLVNARQGSRKNVGAQQKAG